MSSSKNNFKKIGVKDYLTLGLKKANILTYIIRLSAFKAPLLRNKLSTLDKNPLVIPICLNELFSNKPFTLTRHRLKPIFLKEDLLLIAARSANHFTF